MAAKIKNGGQNKKRWPKLKMVAKIKKVSGQNKKVGGQNYAHSGQNAVVKITKILPK